MLDLVVFSGSGYYSDQSQRSMRMVEIAGGGYSGNMRRIDVDAGHCMQTNNSPEQSVRAIAGSAPSVRVPLPSSAA